jgi:hypothetical protein
LTAATVVVPFKAAPVEVASVTSLTFALSTNAKNFSTGFPRSPLASADRDAESGVVETYPLELPAAKLR